MREPDVKYFKVRAEIKLTYRNCMVTNKGWAKPKWSDQKRNNTPTGGAWPAPKKVTCTDQGWPAPPNIAYIAYMIILFIIITHLGA